MNKDDIISMAREAGFDLTMFELSLGFVTHGTHEEFEHFAAIVAAAEREECAKLCESLNEDFDSLHVESCAEAIRSRGEN